MSLFYRRPHFRRSKNGNVHFVSGHWVERDGWGVPPDIDAHYEGGSDSGASFLYAMAKIPCGGCGEIVRAYKDSKDESIIILDSSDAPWWRHQCSNPCVTDEYAGSVPYLGPYFLNLNPGEDVGSKLLTYYILLKIIRKRSFFLPDWIFCLLLIFWLVISVEFYRLADFLLGGISYLWIPLFFLIMYFTVFIFGLFFLISLIWGSVQSWIDSLGASGRTWILAVVGHERGVLCERLERERFGLMEQLRQANIEWPKHCAMFSWGEVSFLEDLIRRRGEKSSHIG